jgi:hypothetical protein
MFNDVTKDATFYTTTSRFVAWLGAFSQERQKLWLPKDDHQDSSSWSSSPLLPGQEDDEEDDTVEADFADGTGANTRFNEPKGVVVAANGDIFVADTFNHAIRVITPHRAVRTLCGNGKAGFADAQEEDSRFNWPCDLALEAEENLLVADYGNHAIDA